ncbi:hypothetical protein SAMN02745751_03243 [Dethiosulfatibacter aminovorans DSM 17477]|uniref:GrdX protein n=1 Tax=Dethiosulfatibacter aminovorans DSM 17477 TaxID=1121476 RepID=A0A1M6LPL7_9FIRM|nr:GrdX family protein [Dethiosulfatibacter aminovorans]SHJ73165.1 hypothetical protein SAMN02745751_03243 [Dethiosulfatibacter aminovorans DSM 17477]
MSKSEEIVLVTNNDRFLSREDGNYTLMYEDCSYMDVLNSVRNRVHSNYRILTHPMAGSLKPNQTPYKSVLLIKDETIDFKSLEMIESAIASAEKFMKFRKLPNWTEKCLRDFKTLDLSFIEGALLNKSRNSYYIKTN